MKPLGCCIEVFLFLLALFLVFLAFAGQAVPLEASWHLGLGWFFFLSSVVPQMSVSRMGVVTAVVALALFVAGLQRLAAWWSAAVRGANGQPPNGAWKMRWTLLVAGTIFLSFVAGIALVGVTHQAVWIATSSEPLTTNNFIQFRSGESRQSLKEIGEALQGHLEEHQHFPPGGTFDRLGRPLVSWQTCLLPYLGETRLFEQIDRERPWDSPENSAPLSVIVAAYANPVIAPADRIDGSGRALSRYAGNGLVLGAHPGLTVSALSDGTSHTFVAGEAKARYKPWGYPLNWRDARLGINKSPEGFGSPWTAGAPFLMADGSVRFINDNVNPKVFEAAATPDGGEPPGEF